AYDKDSPRRQLLRVSVAGRIDLTDRGRYCVAVAWNDRTLKRTGRNNNMARPDRAVCGFEMIGCAAVIAGEASYFNAGAHWRFYLSGVVYEKAQDL
ncbi:hypothetical protein, partial [Mesorhizobium sp. M1E.F.Ca.ET.063.01.1.1]|uniref:hypothetical protein n=1 Tax=Mesorhizobium sp. M1E.F.Ca.ET.063.01.1.1 TaxID=2496750 RepID=UPI001FE232A5